MSRLTIDVGTTGNAATGDSLRTAFTKVNTNFEELYAELGADGSLSDLNFTDNIISTDNTNQNIILSPNGTGLIDVDNRRIINVADPTSAQDAATKAYVDAQNVAQAITFVGDDSTGTAVNSGETFKIAGTQNITTAVSGDTLTITGPNLNNIINVVGDDSTGVSLNKGETIKIAGGTGLTSVVSGDTITLEIDSTVATLTGSQELTNKTITFGSNTISGTAAQFNNGVVDADFATLDGSEVLTNKTISTASNTITGNVVTIVGDDSSGTAVNIGETFKIAGAQNITTAVSGDTLTITGPNLSSYLTNSTITVVGDDSTGTTLNTGETIKIAGAQNITTAVSGDTLTITGPDLSSYVTENTNVTFNVLKIDDGVHEKFQAKADATGVVTHDCASGHIFYHTSPDADWTANFTNLNLSSGYATAVTLVIVQGGTGYYPSAVQIGGAAQTLNWQGNATPTPSSNRTDVVTFSIINNSGTYTVLGQLTGF